MAEKDFVFGEFLPEWFSTTAPNDGGSFTRHPIGDYGVRIKDIEIKPSQGAEPHNMILVTTTTVRVIEGDQLAIGAEMVGRYGTPQSPKFMQQRAAQLFHALSIKERPTKSMLIGREFDCTVTWEKGKPEIDQQTGEEKIYVNSRMAFERPAGAPKPAKSNAQLASAAAIAYLESKGEGSSGNSGEAIGGGDTAPWQPEGAGQGAGGEQTGQQGAGATTAVEYVDESQVPNTAHAYRAIIAMGAANADVARNTLVSEKIDPTGVINPEFLTGKVKDEYVAWKAKQAPAATDDGLPPLDGGNGAQAPTGKGPKTGTRAGKGATT